MRLVIAQHRLWALVVAGWRAATSAAYGTGARPTAGAGWMATAGHGQAPRAACGGTAAFSGSRLGRSLTLTSSSRSSPGQRAWAGSSSIAASGRHLAASAASLRHADCHPITYHPDFRINPVPEGHRFPMPKDHLLYERLQAEGLAGRAFTPGPADEEVRSRGRPPLLAASPALVPDSPAVGSTLPDSRRGPTPRSD